MTPAIVTTPETTNNPIVTESAISQPETHLLWNSADLELMPDNGNRYEIIICQSFPV
jgi:hypothetical protein